MTAHTDAAPGDVIDRLAAAVNARDLEAVVDCFGDDYRNETPAHPSRGFSGSEQVRTNWSQIFTFVPDITARVLRRAVDGDAVWTEWEMRGTRRDGTPHAMSGVIIFGVRAGRARWARFYLEPVEQDAGGIDRAVRTHVGAPPADVPR